LVGARHFCLRYGAALASLIALAPAPVFADAELEECLTSAGARYGVPPELLRSIASAESGLDPLAVRINRDGSRDIGIMQINSWWLGILVRYGIGEADLRDACLNVHVGAWILAGNIERYGYTWRAVGAYNAGTGVDQASEQRRNAYALRVSRHLARAGAVRLHDGPSTP